jgi:glucose/arabinose dehydrogenase
MIGHSERSEESTWSATTPRGHERPAGFFAALRMTMGLRRCERIGGGSAFIPDDTSIVGRKARPTKENYFRTTTPGQAARSTLGILLFAAVAVSARAADWPFTPVPAFGAQRFDQPVAIVSRPGDTQRLFVIEKPGRIMILELGETPKPARVFLDLTAQVGDDAVEQGVLALAFHPDWRRNRQCYVWYTSCLSRRFRTTREDRLSRFLVAADNPDVADPGSELKLIAQEDDAANHNGGELLFGPDGCLYLSLGDEGGGNDQYRNSQRIDKDFFSGILRLDVDQRPGSLPPNPHPAVQPGAYAIPPDNPFVGVTTFNGKGLQPERVHTEFWAVGLRNPWRMSFDPATGQLWCGDVGQATLEEVDVIVRGGNYGWNYREGTRRFEGTPPPEAKFVEPVWEYSHREGGSITGGLVYRGERFPELEGKYLFADYLTGRVWALDAERPGRAQQIATAPTVVSFGRDPRNGDVLLASFTGNRILRLVRNR